MTNGSNTIVLSIDSLLHQSLQSHRPLPASASKSLTYQYPAVLPSHYPSANQIDPFNRPIDYPVCNPARPTASLQCSHGAPGNQAEKQAQMQLSVRLRSQASQQSRQAPFSSSFRPYLISHCSSQSSSQILLLLLLLPRSQIRWPRRSEIRKHAISIRRRPRPRPSVLRFRFKRWNQVRSVLRRTLASMWYCIIKYHGIGWRRHHCMQSLHSLES